MSPGPSLALRHHPFPLSCSRHSSHTSLQVPQTCLAHTCPRAFAPAFPLLEILFPKTAVGLIYTLTSRSSFKYYTLNETSLTTIFKIADFPFILIPLSLIYFFL